jgi:hypothetical protein
MFIIFFILKISQCGFYSNIFVVAESFSGSCRHSKTLFEQKSPPPISFLLSLSVVVAHRAHGGLEVGRRLLLDLKRKKKSGVSRGEFFL